MSEELPEIECPACGEKVIPKKAVETTRRGKIMSFVRDIYNCPKCGEKRIYDK